MRHAVRLRCRSSCRLNKAIHSDIGYTISAVSGNQFFNDAQEVNGSLQSAYQSPFVNIAWTVNPDWICRADYNYYGYGEGGPSGAPLCSTGNCANRGRGPLQLSNPGPVSDRPHRALLRANRS